MIDESSLDCQFGFELAGSQGLLRTNSQELVGSFQSFLSPAEEHPPTFEMFVQVKAASGRGPMDPYFRGMHHLVVATFGSHCVFLFDLRRRKIKAMVSTELASDLQFWKCTLLPIAAGVLGPTIGVVPIHAACLVTEDEGVLVAGLSGAGKSTLAVALAQSGYKLLSDDWSYIHDCRGSLMAHGLSAPVKLLPQSLQFFPELVDYRLQRSMNGELAYEVDAKHLGIEDADRCTPKAIVFLQRTASTTSFVPQSRATALKYFLGNAERLPEQLPEAARYRSHVLSSLSEIPAFLFSYRGSPQEGALALRNSLNGIRCFA